MFRGEWNQPLKFCRDHFSVFSLIHGLCCIIYVFHPYDCFTSMRYFLFMCRLFELYAQEGYIKLVAKKLHALEGVGPQKCLAFSVEGSVFATGGVVSTSL